ncbi:MAG TPA: tetratricopeptide repeat protein [Pyrinomonadaceae bacterium]|nr:tetratricopeptide repeat protein [Pyrinomonadaceae bacterium]
MGNNLRHLNRYLHGLALAGVIGLSACQTGPVANSGRQEIESVPGAVSYSESFSGQGDLLIEARNRLAKRDFAGAEKIYREVISLEPGNAPGYIGLASCRVLQNDFDAAEQNYRRALELDKKSTMAVLGLGTVATYRGRYEEAAKFYRQALEIDPSNADAHWGAALAYDQAGNEKEAREHYQKFLQLAPNSGQAPQARLNLARLGKAPSKPAAR